MPETKSQRDTLRSFVQKPLTAWLRRTIKGVFTDPNSTEAFDITAEAVAGAVKDVIGSQPNGSAVLRQLALELLDQTTE